MFFGISIPETVQKAHPVSEDKPTSIKGYQYSLTGCRPKGFNASGPEDTDDDALRLDIPVSAMSERHIGDTSRRRQYCSHECLLGLAGSGPLDPKCPNSDDHKQKHLQQPVFLSLMHEQLARDRGAITDCQSLYIEGCRDGLFKITLTTHGYTMIAKGMQQEAGCPPTS